MRLVCSLVFHFLQDEAGSFTGIFSRRRRVQSLVFHFLQDGDDHVKARSLAWLLVHADVDESGHVRGDAGRDADAKTFQRHLDTEETCAECVH